jgi:lipid II isoglutaminyl synthase (glutamine-hydrolysing)
MNPRERIALITGKAAGGLSRLLGFGGGSTLPGRLAIMIDPGFVREMTSTLPEGCVLVTGTNGKTTTAALVASILEGAGTKPVHNRTGANLMAGIASTLILNSGIRGDMEADLGLFEVDEATLPEAVRESAPRLVLVNNLFRDQLDRYGELDTLARKMKGAVESTGSATVILNADDPLVASIGGDLVQRTLYFGIDTDDCASASMQHAADSKHCPACGTGLDYEYHLFGHLGRYRCPGCGSQRPEADFSACELKVMGMEGTWCRVRYPGGTIELEIPLPGLYNVYNGLAAFATAVTMGIEPSTTARMISRFRAAFGRVEKVEVGDRRLLMILAKNPAGFNEVIRTLCTEPGRRDILLALNDNIADGRDVSWIWDVDFEALEGRLRDVVCSGIRAWDMALRVKYAELSEESLLVEPDLARALEVGLEAVGAGDTLYVVPTYTAMLELRRIMARRKLVTQFWEK